MLATSRHSTTYSCMQLQDDDDQLIKNINITAKHSVVKRSTNTTSPNCSEKTLEILRGRDGRDGKDGSQGPRGRDGRDGLPGPKGMTGPPGQKGDTGVPGPKGERAGGIVYIRWGHNSCPKSGAQLVYKGRAGASAYNHQGGGGNPQCLPLDPTFYKTVSGTQNLAFMYGAEYEATNSLVSNSDDTDVPCAVCYVPTRNALYMIPAKYDCPKDWTREYFGYLMSEHYNHQRSQFSCVDHSLTSVIGSSHKRDSLLFYPVEGVCGSLPCPPYSPDKELSCAVCTK